MKLIKILRVPNSIPFYWTQALHCVCCVAAFAHVQKTGQNLATLLHISNPNSIGTDV